jgi:hypothetical protein
MALCIVTIVGCLQGITSGNKVTPWVVGFFPNTNHLKQQIETHAKLRMKFEATKTLAQLKAGK